MRKLLVCIILIAALMIAYNVGNRDGVRHAIMDARIYPGSDDTFELELDGQVYEYLP